MYWLSKQFELTFDIWLKLAICSDDWDILLKYCLQIFFFLFYHTFPLKIRRRKKKKKKQSSFKVKRIQLFMKMLLHRLCSFGAKS